MLLVPVDADVVAVVRTPVATVVMYDGFPLFSRGTVDMSGTMVGAVWAFLGRDTILTPVWQDSCRRRW